MEARAWGGGSLPLFSSVIAWGLAANELGDPTRSGLYAEMGYRAIAGREVTDLHKVFLDRCRAKTEPSRRSVLRCHGVVRRGGRA